MYKILFLLFIPYLALAQKPGTQKDSVVCLNSPGYNYAVYVPASYKPTVPVGVILIFDPGARGKLPVSLYQKVADKYEVILACSNNSRNGPVDQSLTAGTAVLEDVIARFNVDRSFILTSGFSGGGRTAVQMAITRSTIAGVITCGAALPSQAAITKAKQVPFAEVIGQLDMNYQESLLASVYLRSIGNPSSLTFFYGGHQWPPAEAYDEALAWHRLRSKKINASKFFSEKMKNMKVQLDSGHVYEANRMLMQLMPDFSESKHVFTIDSAIAAIQKDKRLKSETSDVGKINQKEIAMQKEFLAHYTQHMAYAAPDSAYHAVYWKGFRRDCEKMLASGGYKKLAGLRLIDYGWRLCAEQHFVLLDYGQTRQAAMAARIWALIVPDRPAPCTQAARAFALLKRKSEMMEYLRMAVERGLKDKQAIIDDPAFKDYAILPEFQAILK